MVSGPFVLWPQMAPDGAGPCPWSRSLAQVTVSDGQGLSLDGQGQSLDGQGKSLDGQGKYADGQGKSLDGPACRRWTFRGSGAETPVCRGLGGPQPPSGYNSAFFWFQFGMGHWGVSL